MHYAGLWKFLIFFRMCSGSIPAQMRPVCHGHQAGRGTSKSKSQPAMADDGRDAACSSVVENWIREPEQHSRFLIDGTFRQPYVIRIERKPLQRSRFQMQGTQQKQQLNTIELAVAMDILTELSVRNPVPAIHGSSLSHQLQQGFWDGAQAGEEQINCLERSALSSTARGKLDNRGGAALIRLDHLGSFSSPGAAK